MQRRVGLKGILIIVAAGLLAVFLAVIMKPQEVEALKNQQIYGLVFWGTSNVTRMYNDLGYETWLYADEDSGYAKAGTEEQGDHIWVSNVGENDDFRNYFAMNTSPENLTNYWVGDAKETANSSSTWKGQQTNGLDAILSKIVKKNNTVAEENDKKVDYEIAGSTSENPKNWIEQKKSKKKNDDGVYETELGSDEWKTAIVLWAGEDWVVQGTTASDTGMKDRDELQKKWMSQITAEVASKADKSNDIFKYMDVDKDDTYPLHDYKTLTDIDDKEYTSGDGYSVSGYGTNATTLGIASGSSGGHTSNGTFLKGESAVTGYAHEYVFDNSYIISDENLAAFSYNAGNDGIDVSLEHQLSSPTDPFPVDSDLATQSGTCYGRLLSGYSYEVEYLTQDTDTVPDAQSYDSSTITVWVPDYHEAYTEDASNNSSLSKTDVWQSDEISSNDKSLYEGTYTSQSDVEHYSELYNCGEAYLTEAGHNIYHPTTMVVTDEVEIIDPIYEYYQRTDGVDEDGNTIYRDENGNRVSSSYRCKRMIKDYTYIHHISVTYTIEHPAYYDWTEEEQSVQIRCDTDHSADAGYADSYHDHEYGGVNGLSTADQSQLSYTDDGGSNVEHYIGDDGNGGYSSVTTGGGSGNDHRYDYTTHTEWYTDLNKPIMTVVTENRSVVGYIDYWHHYTSSSLKVYLFSLGPYNKAIYEDQMDDNWRDDSTNEVQVEQTKRIEDARTTWNTVVSSNATSAQFMNIYDSILEEIPYYRYQDVTVDTETNVGGTNDVGGTSDAQHGKWYDRKTNEWIFHAIWNTVLEDNPNEEFEETVDTSFYNLSASLTAYANMVTSPNGRNSDDETMEVETTDDDGNVTGTQEVPAVIHTLAEISAAGMSAGGDAVGFGDEDYGFIEQYMTTLSSTSVVANYSALDGIEGFGTESSTNSPMYEYSRYGKLLEDLGLDEVGSASTLFSPRTIPGALVSISYIANSGLVFVWDLAMQGLKILNPFEFLSNATYIANEADELSIRSSTDTLVDPFTGVEEKESDEAYLNEMTENPITVYNYDDANSIFVRWAAKYPVFKSFMAGIGKIYDIMQQMGYLMMVLFVVAFVAGVLLFQAWRKWVWKWTGKFRNLIIRLLFILIGIPLLGALYTEMLDAVDTKVNVVSSGSSDIISVTFVDFEGWVKNSRLTPVDGTVLESEDTESSSGGQPSDASYQNLRKTISSINSSTGIVSAVLDANANDLNDSSWWNNRIWNTTEVDSTVTVDDDGNISLSSGATESANWRDDYTAIQQIFAFLTEYTNGSFYYASSFSSETMAEFYKDYPTQIGRRRGTYEDEESWEEQQEANENSLYQLYSETQGMDSWLDRKVEDNTLILTGTGKYAGEDDGDSEESTNWSHFNMYANGGMTASHGNGKITYSPSENYGGGAGSDTPGLDMSAHVGLSTLSMYNYLATDFGDTSLVVYSVANSPSGYTENAHYSVNVAGSGLYQWIYYINCLAFLAVAAIVGIVFALQMIISIVRSAFKILFNTPFALVGVLGSISTVIITVVTMIAEILITMIGYNIVSELMMVIVELFEGPIVNGVASAYANTLQATAGTAGLSASVIGYMVGLIMISVIFVLFGIWLIKNHNRFMRVFAKSQDLVFGLLLYSDRVPEVVKEKQKRKKQRKKRSRIRVLLLCTKELLKS